MEEVVIFAKERSEIGKQMKVLRRQGLLPGIIYGKGLEPKPIVLDYREVTRILPGISSSRLLTVDIGGEKHITLVREKQHHPVTGSLLHVDFQKVSLTERIRVTVGINLIGDSPAVKNFNGVIVTGVENLEVECLPQDLPDHIDVDISKLETIGSAIYVRDIFLPPQIEVFTESHEMVVLVTPPEAEEVEEVAEAVEVAAVEPEVIEKGKKEEEEY
jgi:large subunit ribosomal protein L25